VYNFHVAQIGSIYQTGQKCPESGVYRFFRHTDGSFCQPTQAEYRIPLAKGDTFPPHRRCQKGVVWQLESYA